MKVLYPDTTRVDKIVSYVDVDEIKKTCAYAISSKTIAEKDLIDLSKAVLSYINESPNSVDEISPFFERLISTSIAKYPNSLYFSTIFDKLYRSVKKVHLLN